MTTVERRRASAFQNLLAEIAKEYSDRGYSTKVEPGEHDLPDFLVKYRPDMIAEKGSELVVVEVRAPIKSRRPDYWAELAADVNRHPGWRLDLIVRANAYPEQLPMQVEKVRCTLRDAATLAETGMLDAALLIAWSAFEASAIHAIKHGGLQVSDYKPAALISALFSEGLIERDEYETLLGIMRERDQVAHGYQATPVDRATIVELERISSGLLNHDLGD